MYFIYNPMQSLQQSSITINNRGRLPHQIEYPQLMSDLMLVSGVIEL